MERWCEVLVGIHTLTSAGMYAVLVVTFGCQASRVDGFRDARMF